MTPFASLSSLVRAAFALWALILCVVDILNATLSINKKRYVFSAPALILFNVTYFLWQIIFDFSLSARTGSDVSAVTAFACGTAWGWWLFAFLLMTLATLFLLGYNVRYEKTFITPNSIKEYLDEVACGVCCWRDNGRVVFSNICMNRLCVALTGGQLLNGEHFRQAVKEGILTVDDRMWRFTCRDITLGGEIAHEMIASDVTTVYAETQALKEDEAKQQEGGK